MTPTDFPQANEAYGPPPELEESQCATIPVFRGIVERGSVEGTRLIVCAWKPDARELAALNAGAPVFLSMLGGLQPHFLTTNFEEATSPA